MQGEEATARSVLKITGGDRLDFLQGLVTNDLAKLENGLVYAALLNPQGKYLADFFLVPTPDAILIDVATPLAAPLIQRLSMYRLRADVGVAQSGMHVHLGLGPAPEGAFADPRHAALGWRAYHDTAGTAATIDWAAINVANAIPTAGAELITDDSYILEMGFERLNGVDFKKGCYVGQEVTARMKHKTELRKGLAQVVVTGSAPSGTPITAEGKPVGTLFTQSGERALAYLRFDRAKGEMSAGEAKLSLADQTKT